MRSSASRLACAFAVYGVVSAFSPGIIPEPLRPLTESSELAVHGGFALHASTSPVASQPSGLSRWVDPFIGTAGAGGTFPGAIVPWGMVSASPHTLRSEPGGYRKGNAILGFGQVHLSGSPTVLGMVLLRVGVGNPRGQSEASHEHATPGYYSVVLSGSGIRVEATATVRSTLYRVHFPESGRKSVQIDAGHALGVRQYEHVRSQITTIGPQRIEGWAESSRIGGLGDPARVYFSAEVNAPSTSRGGWRDGRAVEAREAPASASTAWWEFLSHDSLTLMVRIGISYVDLAGARRNVASEQPSWDFEGVRRRAERSWNDQLARIEVRGGSDVDRKIFYTALYHVLLHPSVFSDVDGRFRRFRSKGQIGSAPAPRYAGFSLWDTYRTVHPLLTLAYPERARGMVRSLVEMQRESGWLPLWELAGQESNNMVGDPAAIVIAEAYLKGVAVDDPGGVLAALVHNASRESLWTADAGQTKARIGLREYLRLGYVPEPPKGSRTQRTLAWLHAYTARVRHQFYPKRYEQASIYGTVSTSQEYAHADACIARLARRLGFDMHSAVYGRRALGYRALFNSVATWRDTAGRQVQGFFRSRTAAGRWASSDAIPEPAAPRKQRPGFVEGDEWSYLFNAPHDVPGLIALAGSSARLIEKLDSYFSLGAHDASNEPAIAYPYLYDFVGAPWRTQEEVQRIIRGVYDTTAAGIPGEDDAGTLSAWLVWSAIGLYPLDPCDESLAITSPLFTEIVIRPGEARGTVHILADKDPRRASYIRGVSLGGKPLVTATVPQRALLARRELRYRMSESPSAWGGPRPRPK